MSLKSNEITTKVYHNHEELLQSIQRDRALVHSYVASSSLKDASSSSSAPIHQQQHQQRDSYDLFFESACISIKSLPPKLAAEAKSRISQIITEYELRAITEQEAQQDKELHLKVKPVKVVTDNLMDSPSEIVYEFEPYN